jgi:hypothetical protein
MIRKMILAACATLPLFAAPAFASPDFGYLQNGLDGRGRCLGSTDSSVAMTACSTSPSQEWTSTPGDIPGYFKFHTMAGGETMCLAAQPADRKNVLRMAACDKSEAQQWYVVRITGMPKLLYLTNRAAGATRCLEAQQTGIKLTPCGRKQPGHQWGSNFTPTM